ncbi:MAG: type II toxin-antitoxin system HicB family antitoxin [Nitrososphaerota archaeon]|nr:type II toxin-antitoxin system HicB family antitoxin [Nitrososphaerota archaeon]
MATRAKTFTISLIRDPETGWYAARCVELPEAISQGKTETEAVRNVKEAIELVLEDRMEDSKKKGGKLMELIVKAK